MMLALDWGSSNLRASLLDDEGRLVESRRDAHGVMSVVNGAFEEALGALCRDWMAARPGLPIMASGMIGSRQGWIEAPYLELPASPEQAAAALATVDLRTHKLHIVPGLREQIRPNRWDVLRGEETQVWGTAFGPAGGTAILPGTHSKWLGVDGAGRVRSLRTWMTGELYALLSEHGSVARLMQHGRCDDAAFEAGVALGAQEHAQATHAFFAVRTASLVGGVAAASLPDHLSGLLIGIEIAAALKEYLGTPLVLIGEPALCQRYERALRLLGAEATIAREGATERGLWRVACAAGLVESGR